MLLTYCFFLSTLSVRLTDHLVPIYLHILSTNLFTQKYAFVIKLMGNKFEDFYSTQQNFNFETDILSSIS